MWTSNKIVVFIFVVFMTVSISAKYYKFHINHDFALFFETSCDPTSEVCFVYECEYPSNEDCTPYKYTEVSASDIYHDGVSEDAYGELFYFECAEADSSCEVTYCDPDVTVEGETCTQTEDVSDI